MYTYACADCGHRFDIRQEFSEDALTDCPECAGRLRKQFGNVGVVFRGPGFYRTDSRSDSSGAAASNGAAAKNGSSGKGDSGGKGESASTGDSGGTSKSSTPSSTTSTNSTSSSTGSTKAAASA